ncbi:MAG: hypothetical protein KDD45_14975, partial [Bdellovibrionales bacterium]|nr:hypothetical protein [Bdellovibrionales bacterium]
MELNQIIKNVNSQVSQLSNYERLTDIYSGNLIEYVKAELSKEMSAASFAVASQRIASINLFERIVNKLSKVYSDTPNRQTPDEKDQELLNQYVQDIDAQDVMSQAEILLNMNKTFALEPYLDNGTFKVRVLAPYEFTVLSDDAKNPKKITHFVKFMGQTKSKSNKTVNVYWIYTNEEFIIADSDGNILDAQLNPYGVIPFVYVNASRFKLKPKPDNDSYNNSILIPKLLTDLNYAVQYQSHSIMYGIDLDASNLKGNPDSFWSIQSSEGENKKP